MCIRDRASALNICRLDAGNLTNLILQTRESAEELLPLLVAA